MYYSALFLVAAAQYKRMNCILKKSIVYCCDSVGRQIWDFLQNADWKA